MSDAERATLRGWTRAGTTEQRQALRARIVLRAGNYHRLRGEIGWLTPAERFERHSPIVASITFRPWRTSSPGWRSSGRPREHVSRMRGNFT